MKKVLFLAIAGITVLAAGCGTSSTQQENTSKKGTEFASKTPEIALTEIFTKALEKQDNLQSYTTIVSATQAITMEDGTNVEMKSKLQADQIMEPYQFFVDSEAIATELESGESEEVLNLKMYLTADENLYLYEGSEDEWLQMPKGPELNEMLDAFGLNINTIEQLKILEKYAEDFTYEENGEKYILTLKGDSEKLAQLSREQLALTISDANPNSAELRSTKFEDAFYQVVIDKSTFDVKKIQLDWLMKPKVQDDEMTVDQKTTIVFENINAVSTITVPQEVIDNAHSFE
ncbi:DUF6612 family protein [Bacillus ndiopicus]|uniref:DUF6612 family protein n=1 Tax=Bacillus ndiopicus TaxID=1347368 RepID=UPI0005A81EF2|nr:DUF6612 family protein [Bacillus ndiopicus]